MDLQYSHNGIYSPAVPRLATTFDVFNAIAEPRRRRIIDALAPGGTRSVGALVESLRMPQPAVSKHLGVLRKVGLVSASKHGQQRLYQLNAAALKPVHDWVRAYERFWAHQLGRIRERAERRAREARDTSPDPQRNKPTPEKGTSS